MWHSSKTKWDLATKNSNQYRGALTCNMLCHQLKRVLGANKVNNRIKSSV
jgi:hypothetical protein